MNLTDEEAKEVFCKPGDERALLCCAINRLDDFYAICSKINENDFLYPDHKMLYILLKTLSNKGVAKFDVSLIGNEAQNHGILENVGGYGYIESISGMPLDKTNLGVFMESVLDASIKYRLYSDLNYSLEKIVGNAKTGENSGDLITSVESRLMDLSTASKFIEDARDFGDGLKEYVDGRRSNQVEQSGLSTGFPILDKQIDGLIPGTLTILAARKKMGKSAFLSNIAAHVAYRLRTPVLYVDTEMSFEEWRDRIIAMMSGVEERIVKHGGYTDEQYDIIVNKCIKIVEKGKLFHERLPGYSIDKLTALYKKYKIKENIGLAIFDYIKEPDSSSTDRRRQEWQVLGDVSTRMKDLAGILNIPFLTAAQLNREGDLAGSDRISWFADIVMMWGEKGAKEIEDGGFEAGQYKLVIRDTRRGGSTPEEGIGYKFRKKRLEIKEVASPFQLIPYGENTIDRGSDDNEELK